MMHFVHFLSIFGVNVGTIQAVKSENSGSVDNWKFDFLDLIFIRQFLHVVEPHVLKFVSINRFYILVQLITEAFYLFLKSYILYRKMKLKMFFVFHVLL